MTDKITQMLARYEPMPPTPEQVEAQRRSFAYGTSHIENEAITRRMIDEEADRFGR
ncbi:MAG: hypothetical protein WBF53_01980 [Litorimonas sp.]